MNTAQERLGGGVSLCVICDGGPKTQHMIQGKICFNLPGPGAVCCEENAVNPRLEFHILMFKLIQRLGMEYLNKPVTNLFIVDI